MTRSDAKRAERQVTALLVVGALGALATAAVYAFGGQPQLEGVFLAVAFAGLGAGLVVWAHRLLRDVEVEEHWEYATDLDDDNEELTEFHDDLDRDDVLERRPLLRRTLLGTLATIGIAAIFPIRSLGPSPGNALRVTPWAKGRRLVDGDGKPIRRDEVPVGGLVTVFPEGRTDAADSVAVLIRVAVDADDQPPGATEGLYVYSKICTHAGCPVGLYVDDRRTLLCPCHQSEFDVVDGAAPISGPAARSLPRLPIEVDQAGVVVATGDFDQPVGPAWWSR